jgi:hypothetical protein
LRHIDQGGAGWQTSSRSIPTDRNLTQTQRLNPSVQFVLNVLPYPHRVKSLCYSGDRCTSRVNQR